MGSDTPNRSGSDAALKGSSPYLGALGRTRLEAAQVWMPDGKIRALAVYTGIDAAADPELAASARVGALHQLDDGIDLALPLTYHDPVQALFVIVVPEGLRHRALAVRAEHMRLLAADAAHAVPDYVRECEIVFGAAGLRRRIRTGVPVAALRGVGDVDADERFAMLRERELAIERRERLVSVREQVAASAANSIPARPVLDSELEEVDANEPGIYGPAILAEDLRSEGDAEFDNSGELEDVQDGDAILEVEDAEEIDGRADVRDADQAIPFPPSGFFEDTSTELALVQSGGRVWLFARGCPTFAREREDLDLLVQLDPERAEPVVLLSLVCGSNESPTVLRGVLDLDEPEQARALEMLSHRFLVQLVALDHAGRLQHWAMLTAPREQNVNAVLSFLAERPSSRSAWLAACEEVLASPPPWRNSNHPFQDGGADPHARSATEAAVALDELVDWLAPERRARLMLLLSVPSAVIDAHYRAGICDALDWGLALPPALRPAASELGMAGDESALLLRRIAGLCRTSSAEDFGGLEAGVLRTLWSEAVERAVVLGVELSAQAEELLRKHVGDRALTHAEALAESSDSTRTAVRDALLKQDPPDIKKLIELVQLGSYRDLLELGALSARLSPRDATTLFVRMVARKDAIASDALVTLLSRGQEPRVRACAGLGLSALRAVDAIEGLSHGLQVEQAPDWRVFALCLGRYGVGSFRAIQRALVAKNVDDEKMAYVYAYLALHGARAQVRARGRSSDQREASIAERAIALAGTMKDANTPALGLEKQGSLTVFCDMFDRSLRALGASPATPVRA